MISTVFSKVYFYTVQLNGYQNIRNMKPAIATYEGRSINMLQNGVILLSFQNIKKILKYMFCRELNSEYLL